MAFWYKLIGTSHVAKESLEVIQKAVDRYSPDIICVELDADRLRGLLRKESSKTSIKMIRTVGFWGYIFASFAQKGQKYLGRKLDVTPGMDMLHAVTLAKERNIELALIDQHIQKTLRRLSKKITFRDKIHMLLDVLLAVFRPKKAMKKMLDITDNFDIRTIPSDTIVLRMISYLKVRYPGIYAALIEERNVYMVEKIIALCKKYPLKRILVVVGAGHVAGMETLLKEKLLKIEYIS